MESKEQQLVFPEEPEPKAPTAPVPKPAWRRLRAPKRCSIPETSLPRLLSRYAGLQVRGGNRVHAEATFSFQAAGVVPSTPNAAAGAAPTAPAKGGALGRFRHLFEDAPCPLPPRGSMHPLAGTKPSTAPGVLSAALEAKPDLKRLRQQHSRLRYPRLADAEGQEEELQRESRKKQLAHEERKGKSAVARNVLKTLNEDGEDSGSDGERMLERLAEGGHLPYTAGDFSVVLGHRGLRHRAMPSPRAAILARLPPRPQVLVGAVSSLHTNSMDAEWGESVSNMSSMASLFSGTGASSSSKNSFAGSGLSFAPSSSFAGGALDRKWLARVAPISCLPSQPQARLARQMLAEVAAGNPDPEEDKRQRGRGAGGSAGGYLNFERWGLTDDYIESLLEAYVSRDGAESKPGLVGVEHVNLSGNLLTEQGVAALVAGDGPASNLFGLNLSSNRLGVKVEETGRTTRSLASSLSDLRNLTELDLGGNPLGDNVVEELCKELAVGCPFLEGLGLARCNLGDTRGPAAKLEPNQRGAGAALGRFMVASGTLRCLDLNWNQFQGEGAQALLTGVYDNNTTHGARGAEAGLRRLSLAWNRLGSGRHPSAVGKKQSSSRCARILASIFQDCTVLFHLDLSYNGFDSDDCAILSQGLVSNRTLFGLHLVGNEATMDDLGFIVPLGQLSGASAKAAQSPMGDGMSVTDKHLAMSRVVQATPLRLQLEHPIEVSGHPIAQAPSGTSGLMYNPSLLPSPPDMDSSYSAASVVPPSFSEDRLQAERAWAMERTRVKAIAGSLPDDSEALQYNAKCCWICENWAAFTVVYTAAWTGRGGAQVHSVYALFSIDGFTRPTLLSRSEATSNWTALRMLPPTMGLVQVIFIVDGQVRSSASHQRRRLSAKKSVVLNPDIFGFNVVSQDQVDEADPSQGGRGPLEEGAEKPSLRVREVPRIAEFKEVNTPFVGLSALQRFRRGEPTALCVIEDTVDRTQVAVVPRQVASSTQVKKVEGVEVWHYETSSFKNYLRDSAAKLEECFDVDWKMSRAHLALKGEGLQEQVADYLRQRYMCYFMAFWQAATLDFDSHRAAAGVSFIGWRDYLLQAGGEGPGKLADGRSCRGADLDCIFVAANVVDPKKKERIPVLPDKALARFQFMEAILRVAILRFTPSNESAASKRASKKVTNMSEKRGTVVKALESLQEMCRLGEDMVALRQEIQENVFTEECDLVYREFHEPLEALYECYKYVSFYPGRKGRGLSFGGWLTMIGDGAIWAEDFTGRKFREAFILGREIRADETSNMRLMELSYSEFLVCLAALVRLKPGYDAQFFAEQLTELFRHGLAPAIAKAKAGLIQYQGLSRYAGGDPHNAATVEFLGEIFQEADEDQTGSISCGEFRRCLGQPEKREAMAKFGIQTSDLELFFKTMDTTGDGELDLDELCDGFIKMSNAMRGNEKAIAYLRKAFSTADKDGSGTLDKVEFGAIFKEPSAKKKMESFGLKAEDLEDLFDLVDEDHSGSVTEMEIIAGFINLRDPKKVGNRGIALLSRLFEEADTDGSGSLNKKEWLTAFNTEFVTQQLATRNLKVPDWESLFDQLDGDSSGTIDWEEASQGLTFYWARSQMQSL
ncbi:unnamed protein product [Polarella glacialis]|uniref:EF-hand domain-containing protein n=1 Tax=Polarella glacialis TaxID=89957 RepID=A0A813GW76_POLGL|nr:unnamed protein product [Polarella glacialis]